MAVIAAIGLVLPRGGASSDEPGEPSIVVNLKEPPKTAHAAPAAHDAKTPPAGHDHPPAAQPTDPPQATDVTNLLVAGNGAIVIDPALLHEGSDGPVPVIAPDGRKPSEVYAAKSDATDQRPRVAIVLLGLGMSDSITQLAIDKLPPGTTLALSPYGQNLQNWTAAARAKGHEVLLEIPMEPFDYPENDPGPQTLLTGEASGDNQGRLMWLLGRFIGYAGVTSVQGGKFLASTPELQSFVSQMSSRGLLVFDASMSQRSVAQTVAKESAAIFARAQFQIDKSPNRDAIDAALEKLTAAALERKLAVGVATATPGAIERISQWAATLDAKGVGYAPLTAAAPLYAKTVP